MLGKVLSGDYQIGLSYWTNTADRIGMYDFIPLGKMLGFVLAYFPKPPPYDPLLFARPFRYDAWLVSGIAGFVIAIFLIFSSYILRNGERSDSIKILLFVCWLTYVLIG